MRISLPRRPLDLLLWCAACGMLVSGALLPMFSFHKFYIFDDTFSLLSGVRFLLGEGEYFLFAVLGGFSLLLPACKLVLSAWLLLGAPAPARRLGLVRVLSRIDKWSMADVFVIAVIAATVKLGDLVRIEVHAGLYVFACGVLAGLWLVQRQLASYVLVPREGHVEGSEPSAP